MVAMLPTPLFIAVHGNHLGILDLLVDVRPFPEDCLMARDFEWRTVLVASCQYGLGECVPRLLKLPWSAGELAQAMVKLLENIGGDREDRQSLEMLMEMSAVDVTIPVWDREHGANFPLFFYACDKEPWVLELFLRHPTFNAQVLAQPVANHHHNIYLRATLGRENNLATLFPIFAPHGWNPEVVSLAMQSPEFTDEQIVSMIREVAPRSTKAQAEDWMLAALKWGRPVLVWLIGIFLPEARCPQLISRALPTLQFPDEEAMMGALHETAQIEIPEGRNPPRAPERVQEIKYRCFIMSINMFSGGYVTLGEAGATSPWHRVIKMVSKLPVELLHHIGSLLYGRRRMVVERDLLHWMGLGAGGRPRLVEDGPDAVE